MCPSLLSDSDYKPSSEDCLNTRKWLTELQLGNCCRKHIKAVRKLEYSLIPISLNRKTRYLHFTQGAHILHEVSRMVR